MSYSHKSDMYLISDSNLIRFLRMLLRIPAECQSCCSWKGQTWPSLSSFVVSKEIVWDSPANCFSFIPLSIVHLWGNKKVSVCVTLLSIPSHGKHRHSIRLTGCTDLSSNPDTQSSTMKSDKVDRYFKMYRQQFGWKSSLAVWKSQQTQCPFHCKPFPQNPYTHTPRLEYLNASPRWRAFWTWLTASRHTSFST